MNTYGFYDLLANKSTFRYLVFMVTNFLFIPLVYFCYPETANLTLEEIDYIFSDESKSSVKWSLEMRKEKLKYGRKDSFVDEGLARRMSGAYKDGAQENEGTLRGSTGNGKANGLSEHQEKV